LLALHLQVCLEGLPPPQPDEPQPKSAASGGGGGMAASGLHWGCEGPCRRTFHTACLRPVKPDRYELVGRGSTTAAKGLDKGLFPIRNHL
jgi:hypothetical protein